MYSKVAAEDYRAQGKIQFYCREHGYSDNRCGCPEFEEGNPARKVTEYLVTTKGTWFTAKTDTMVIYIIDMNLNHAETRLRLFLGDTDTGKPWNEENDVVGYVGRSTGTTKIPLLIANRRSMGGGGILTDCIVRLLVDGVEFYRHPKYTESVFTVEDSDMQPEYSTNVKIDGELHARFRTPEKAARWIAFMKGERMGK